MSSWRNLRLKDLCVDGGQYGLNVSAETYVQSGVRLLRTTDISSGVLTPEESGVFVGDVPEARFTLAAGDLLLSRSGTPPGQSYLVRPTDAGMTFAGYLVRFRPRSNVDPRFLAHVARSAPFQHTIQAESVASTIQNFNAERYANIRVAAPDFAQQCRIADFLDAETAKLLRLERHSCRLTELLEERKSALISACYTFAGADEAQVVPLRRVVKRWIDYRGATPEKTDSGIPLVTAKNIRDGRIDYEASREYIAEDAYKDWMRRGLPETEDVLLTTEAPLGQVAFISDTSVALAQRVIVLRVHRDICSPEWVYWYLRSPQGQAELELRATGSTALGIKADRLRGVPIPMPTLIESRRRLRSLSTQVAQIEGLHKKLVRQRTLVAERRQALITAAVTGQFDVTTASGRNVSEGVSA
ncbi:restriction endonuclease subunit S domain-containing protein [Streptomyces tendae]|uniref:hypothetical protein n=1 Tax=Streptomyces tendae TaxID=1932 RepID=UPI0036551F73